jgi:Flp pilus assembly pilin Flp
MESTRLPDRLRVWLCRQDGQALVEYEMIIVLIAVVVILLVALVGGQVGVMLSDVSTKLAHPG